MKLHIDVVNQTLLQKTLPGSTPPRQGSKEYLWIEFAFSEDWRGLLKTVYFQAGEYSEPIILENDTVLVPSYFTQQAEFNVTLVGILGNLVIPTSTIKLTMQPSNTIWEAVPPDTDIPAYQQLVNLAQEAVKKAKAPYIGENGNWWEFKDSGYIDTGVSATGPKGDKGDTGPKGDKGDPGKDGTDGKDGTPGADGYTPVKGVDYWTPAESAEMDAAKTAANNAADNASVAEAAALNAASMADEAASSASISAQNADAAAEEARAKVAELQAKADAGDFNGAKGDKGDPGEKGAKGDPGADGYTPVRGTDYWTDADKAAINADIAAQVAGKVDKIDGKGLSANDYTDADKAAVAKITLLEKTADLLFTTTFESETTAWNLTKIDGKEFALTSALVEFVCPAAAASANINLGVYGAGDISQYYQVTSGIKTTPNNSSVYVACENGIGIVMVRNTGTNSTKTQTNASIGVIPLLKNIVRLYSGSTFPAGTTINVYGKNRS